MEKLGEMGLTFNMDDNSWLNWGAGSGGNYELIYLCQIYAASVCGVDHLILHD